MEHIEPRGYRLSGDLFEDFDQLPPWRWLLIGNLWALLPLAAAVLILWLPYQFYAALGAPLALFDNPAWSPVVHWVFGALVVAGSIVLHEGLHALALVVLGYRARLRFARGYFFATTGSFLTRRHYLIMVLTPITTITLGGIAVLLLLPSRWGRSSSSRCCSMPPRRLATSPSPTAPAASLPTHCSPTGEALRCFSRKDLTTRKNYGKIVWKLQDRAFLSLTYT